MLVEDLQDLERLIKDALNMQASGMKIEASSWCWLSLIVR